MKTITAGLQNSVTTTYDKTKTYMAGRVRQTTQDSLQVIAPALTTFADVNTLFSVAPGHCIVNPTTGRKFELSNTTTNTPTVLLFNFDLTSGSYTYVGKVILTLPSGTHTLRGFGFDDSNTSNIKLYVTSTVTTSLCNGGTFVAWGLSLSDFTVGGTQIYMATGTNQKAVYFEQYAGQLGLAHTGTTSGGVSSGFDSAVAGNKTKIFQQNGTAAAMQIYGWDTSLGNPSVAGAFSGTSQTTAFAGTSPSAYFTMGASQNGYSTTTNTAGAFESVVFTTTSPANFTVTSTTQTVYFMRDLQLVGGQWYFNLATTATGAAVVPTSAVSGMSMMRANGITSSHSLLKTGNITPALTGTIVQAHSFGVVVPTSAPSNPSLNANDCIFLATTTSLYMGLLSDIADGSSSWASFTGVNIVGTGTDIIAPTVANARYSSFLDRWVYMMSSIKFAMKQHINSSIDKVFGSQPVTYYEGQNKPTVPIGANAVVSINMSGGWLFVVGSTVGQRGVIAVDLSSDSFFGNAYFVSPVLNIEAGSIIDFITSIRGYASNTEAPTYYIRSGSSASDAVFNSPTGSWTAITPGKDNAPLSVGPYFQVKGTYNIATEGYSSAAQISDAIISYTSGSEISSKWIGSVDNTTANSASPAYTAFRLQIAYASAVPTLYFRAYDDSGNLVASANTASNPTSFEYSTNNGTSWNALGTIPNTALTTEVRYKWSSPPGVRVSCGLRES